MRNKKMSRERTRSEIFADTPTYCLDLVNRSSYNDIRIKRTSISFIKVYQDEKSKDVIIEVPGCTPVWID